MFDIICKRPKIVHYKKNLCTKIKNKVIITTIMIIYVIQMWQSHSKYNERSTLHSNYWVLFHLNFYVTMNKSSTVEWKKTVYCIFNSDNLHYKSVKKWALLFLFSLRIFFENIKLEKKFEHWNYIFCISDDFMKWNFFPCRFWAWIFFLLIYLDAEFKLVFSIVLQNLENILALVAIWVNF